MTTPNPPETSDEGKPPSRLWPGLMIALFVVLQMWPVVGGRGGQIGFHLATGWIRFLTRTIPRMKLNWDLIATGTLCAIVVLVLAHVFMKSLATPHSATRTDGGSWRWRWTWCGVAGLGVLFLVGMSAGGIVHQAAWIRSSPEPLYERKGGLSILGELNQFRRCVMMAANDREDNVEEIRKSLKNPDGEWTRRRGNEPLPFEKFICLLIVDDARKYSGAILFPRDPDRWKRRDVIYHWTNADDEFHPIGDLPTLLKKHEGHLLAL